MSRPRALFESLRCDVDFPSPSAGQGHAAGGLRDVAGDQRQDVAIGFPPAEDDLDRAEAFESSRRLGDTESVAAAAGAFAGGEDVLALVAAAPWTVVTQRRAPAPLARARALHERARGLRGGGGRA